MRDSMPIDNAVDVVKWPHTRQAADQYKLFEFRSAIERRVRQVMCISGINFVVLLL